MIVVITAINDLFVEKYSDCPALGRFTIRNDGKIIGHGKVLDIVSYKK